MSKKRRSASERRKRSRKFNDQRKEAAIKAKYGASGKPAPVVIKSLDGDVKRVVDQGVFKGRKQYSERLEKAAQEAGYDNYQAYLESPYWRGIRKKVLDRDQHRCVRCGDRKNLTIHHDSYNFIGYEQTKKLKTMCWACHKSIHTRVSKGRREAVRKENMAEEMLAA